ncbi:hypothetical protein K438DRAFT_1881800, partial [Mycena galopus ATCC 62051]
MKAILTVPVSVFYVALRVRGIVVGQHNLFSLLHLGLQTTEMLPRTDSHSPRVYIYSPADSMKLISELRKSPFTSSEHVLHERQDPVRYWNA